MERLLLQKNIDNEKTILEHSIIITNYLETGYLDRNYAIQKYKEFNVKNPTYRIGVEFVCILEQTCRDIKELSDEEIVFNLNEQLIYIGGKSLIKGFFERRNENEMSIL